MFCCFVESPKQLPQELDFMDNYEDLLGYAFLRPSEIFLGFKKYAQSRQFCMKQLQAVLAYLKVASFQEEEISNSVKQFYQWFNVQRHYSLLNLLTCAIALSKKSKIKERALCLFRALDPECTGRISKSQWAEMVFILLSLAIEYIPTFCQNYYEKSQQQVQRIKSLQQA